MTLTCAARLKALVRNQVAALAFVARSPRRLASAAVRGMVLSPDMYYGMVSATGVIQPMEEIGALCRARKVFFHTDAAQAVGKVPVDVDAMKVDLMSISAHKLYGPKGIGAVFQLFSWQQRAPWDSCAPFSAGSIHILYNLPTTSDSSSTASLSS